jgi:hypothetical protein
MSGSVLNRLWPFALGAVLSALLLALSAPAIAGANATTKILEGCGTGEVPTGLSQQAYRQALTKVPTYLSEYSDCSELIHKAQLATAARGRSGGSGGDSGASGASGAAASKIAPATPVEQRELQHAHHSGSAPVRVGDQEIHPGVVHANIASALSSLPTPLLVVLAFLLACSLLVLAGVIRNRVRARRS